MFQMLTVLCKLIKKFQCMRPTINTMILLLSYEFDQIWCIVPNKHKRKSKGQSTINSPKTQVTLGTRHTMVTNKTHNIEH